MHAQHIPSRLADRDMFMRFRGGGVGHMYMRYIEPWLDGTGWGKSWPSLHDRDPAVDQLQEAVQNPDVDKARDTEQDTHLTEINGGITGALSTISPNDRMDQESEGSEGSDEDVDDAEDDVEHDPEQSEEDCDSEAEYESEEEEGSREDAEGSGGEVHEGDPDVSESEEEEDYL